MNQKPTFKKLILFFILGGVLILPFLLLETIDEVYYDLWLKEEIPYAVAEQHVDFLQFSHMAHVMRKKLGWKSGNIFLDWADSQRNETYDSIIAHIPENDTIRVRYWVENTLTPHVLEYDIQHIDYDFLIAVYEKLFFLTRGESKSNAFEAKFKYNDLSNLLRFIIMHTPPGLLERHHKGAYLPRALEATLAEVNHIDIPTFYKATAKADRESLPEISGSLLKGLERFDLGCAQNELFAKIVAFSSRVWEVYQMPNFKHKEKSYFQELLERAVIRKQSNKANKENCYDASAE